MQSEEKPKTGGLKIPPNLNKLKQNKMNGILDHTPEIQIYTAIINQSGSDAPTAEILHNTLPLPAIVTWERTSQGTFTGSTFNSLTEDNTALFITNTNTTRTLTAKIVSDQIRIEQVQGGSLTDGLTNVILEIRKYNNI